MSSFFPDQITDNQNIPPIVFTDFKIFNKSVPIRNAIKSAASNQSYFLESDISEKYDRSAAHPEIVEKLMKVYKAHLADTEDAMPDMLEARIKE